MPRRPDTRPTKAQRDAFQALVQRVNLVDIQLVESHVDSDREFARAHGVTDEPVEVSLHIDASGRVVDRTQVRMVECEVELAWEAFRPGSSDRLASVIEVFLATYILDGEAPVEHETVQAFAEHNATFNVWPFFRESLRATTQRMGLPAFTLPLLKPAPSGEVSPGEE